MERTTSLQLWSEIPHSGNSSCSKTTSGRSELVTWLPRWKIQLGSQQCGVEGASHLAAALEGNNTLRELDLYTNNIGDDGVAPWLQLWSGTRRSRNSHCTTTTLGLRERATAQLWGGTMLSGNSTWVVTILGLREVATWLQLWSRTPLSHHSTDDAARSPMIKRVWLPSWQLWKPTAQLMRSGVFDILKRNRGVHVARKQKVLRFALVISSLFSHLPA
jgi:hypothetical protein